MLRDGGSSDGRSTSTDTPFSFRVYGYKDIFYCRGFIPFGKVDKVHIFKREYVLWIFIYLVLDAVPVQCFRRQKLLFVSPSRPKMSENVNIETSQNCVKFASVRPSAFGQSFPERCVPLCWDHVCYIVMFMYRRANHLLT